MLVVKESNLAHLLVLDKGGSSSLTSLVARLTSLDTKALSTWRRIVLPVLSFTFVPRLGNYCDEMATRTAGGNAAFHNFHNDYAHIADPNERRRLALAEIDK